MVSDKNSVIKVIGIGTAGGIILKNIMQDQIAGISFIAANTDLQVLNSTSAKTKILLNHVIKEELGASALKCELIEESIKKIKAAIEGAAAVVLIAGFGGGTGTNATQVFAQVAQSLGIYTIVIATLPFSSEGLYRMTVAKAGIINLRKLVDSVLVMRNDQICNPAGRGKLDSFKAGDAIISGALQSSIRKISTKLPLSN